MLKKVLIISLTVILVLISLSWLVASSLFPVLMCGDSTYYTFDEVEGGKYILNTTNNEFQNVLFPYFEFPRTNQKYPISAFVKTNKQVSIIFLARETDNWQKDISNLKLCNQSSEVQIQETFDINNLPKI